jgi:hypothetical protein
MANSIKIDLETIHKLYDDVLSQLPTDEDCLNFLIRLIIGIVSCNWCGSTDLDRTGDDRDALCRACKKVTWLTAQSFISGIKKPRAYLMALIYRAEGIAISAAELARVVGVASSTAGCILKKYDLVIHSEMAAIGISLDSRQFAECITKRSTHSPVKQHPLVEFDEIDKQNALLNIGTTPLKLTVDENLIYGLLSDTPSSIDSLMNATSLSIGQVSATLTMLDLAGLAKPCPGDYYVKGYPVSLLAQKKIGPKTKVFIARSVELIRATYQGVSRRYLQCYLGFCWSIFDRAKWNLNSLSQACEKFGPITHAYVTSYVSPEAVLLAPAP